MLNFSICERQKNTLRHYKMFYFALLLTCISSVNSVPVFCNMTTSCGDGAHAICSGAIVPFQCGCDLECMVYTNGTCVVENCFELNPLGKCVRTGHSSLVVLLLSIFVSWTGAPFFLAGATALGMVSIVCLGCTCLGRALLGEKNVFGMLLLLFGSIGLLGLCITSIIMSLHPWERDSNGCLTIDV